MVTTLSLNPSIDRTVEVPDFALHKTNRVTAERLLGAGKGVNVAVVSSRLGMPTRCVGFLAEEGGALIERRLERDHVEVSFVRTPGAVRVNLKVLDPSQGGMTEINEPGSPVSPEALEALWMALEQEAKQSEYLVLTGSLPPGCPEDLYAQILRRFKGGCRSVLDADGGLLAQLAQEGPYLVKPNQQELEQAVRQEIKTLRDVRTHAYALIDQGVSLVAVSMGGEGAVLCDGHVTLFAPSLPVRVYNTVCAGDSMVAGMLYGLSQGAGLPEVLRCGVAAATATVADEREDLMSEPDFRTYYAKVKVGAV